MANHKKDIYLYKSLEEINKSCDTASMNSMSAMSAAKLLQTGDKVIKEARKWFDVGDEEQSYLLYLRLGTLYTHLQKSTEYAKDTKYYTNMMRANMNEVVTRVEALSVSLKNRYEILQAARESDAREKAKEIKDAIENQKKLSNAKSVPALGVNGIIKPPGGLDDEKTYSITVSQLKNRIDQKSIRLLIIDCRGAHDFNKSHLTHPNCISIPQELLDPGLSGNKIEAKLKERYPESFHHWNKRGTFDKIVLYDWNSSYENMQSGSCINTLYTAMTKWDPETTYKSPPLILQGGFRNVYYAYPQLINHPLNAGTDLTKYEDTIGSAVSKKEIESLDSISYPDLDDDQNPNHIDAKSSTQLTNNLSASGVGPTFSGNNNSIPTPPAAKFDRSKKPMSSSSTANINIIPVHSRNGAAEPKVNGKPNGETTETKVLAALDDMIISSKELKTKELELDDIINTEHPANEELRTKLKLKELEIERLKSVITSKDNNLSIAKAEYDALVAKKTKPALPQIRKSQVDSAIDNKLKEKKELVEYVNQIRANRKEKESQILGPDTATKLPTIPGSGSNSPRIVNRQRAGISESTTFPTINSSSTNVGPEVKSTQSGSPLLRPMSQDATPASYQKLKDEPSADSPRSLLKRSHSHPNIQSLNDDDAFNQDNSGSSQVPQFNRNQKPSTARPSDTIVPSRARQFHAINSTEKHRTGLKNLGNTCYMNSIVQCLIHIPGLVSYFQSERWKEHLNLLKRQKSSTNGEVSLEFHAVVQEMNVGHRSIAIMDFRNVIGRHHRSFKGYDQQDSHEFLTILLDWLHEELNQVVKSPLNEQKNDGLSDKEAADNVWTDYCGSNKSKIAELFCGQQKSAVRCLSCGKESVTFESFFNLSVPIPSSSNRKVDIYQCIDLYTTEETVPWNCPHCKSTVKATKKIDLWRLPPYLIIHLQRFYNDGWWKKRLTEVDFPSDNLDLTTRVKGRPSQDNIRAPRCHFMLQAVSNHYGSMDGGHYTAYCRQKSQWAKFDDSEVSQINSRDVVTPAAYILFYNNITP